MGQRARGKENKRARTGGGGLNKGGNRRRKRTRQTSTDPTDSSIRTKQTPLGPFLERGNGWRSFEFLIRLESRL